MANNRSSKESTVAVKPSSYQPSKAKLEEDMSVDATPEDVARAIAPRRFAQEPKGER